MNGIAISNNGDFVTLGAIYECIATGKEIYQSELATDVRTGQPDIITASKFSNAMFENGMLNKDKFESTPLRDGLKNACLSSQVFGESILCNIDFSGLVMADCTFKGTRLIGCNFSSGLFENIKFESRAKVTAARTDTYPGTPNWLVTLAIFILLYCVSWQFISLNELNRVWAIILIAVALSCAILFLIKKPSSYVPKSIGRNRLWDKIAQQNSDIEKDRSTFKSIALGSLARFRDITFADPISPIFERYVEHQAVCDEHWEQIKQNVRNPITRFSLRAWLLLISLSSNSGRSFRRLLYVSLSLVLLSSITITILGNLTCQDSHARVAPIESTTKIVVAELAEAAANAMAKARLQPSPETAAQTIVSAVTDAGQHAIATTECEKNRMAEKAPLLSFNKPEGMECTFFTPFYYSLVTISTLGYGDIAPLNQNAQLFSAMLTIIGYFLLGMLVSLAFARFKN